jgi:hypothetical protein
MGIDASVLLVSPGLLKKAFADRLDRGAPARGGYAVLAAGTMQSVLNLSTCDLFFEIGPEKE